MSADVTSSLGISAHSLSAWPKGAAVRHRSSATVPAWSSLLARTAARQFFALRRERPSHQPRCRTVPGRTVQWLQSAEWRYGHRCADGVRGTPATLQARCKSEEHTSELQSLMRTSYAVFCLKKKK